MEIIDMRTATITEKGQISIPKDVRDIGNFEVGSKVAIITFDDRIEIISLRFHY